MSGPGSGTRPARGGPPRPPFLAGNTLQLTSGARSPRVYSPIAAGLIEELIKQRPDLGAFPEELAAWATAEAQAALLRRDLEVRGTFDDNGEPRNSVMMWLRTFERQAAESRRVLGLTPLAEAHLAIARSNAIAGSVLAPQMLDLEALAALGRRALDGRADPVRAALEAVKAEGAPIDDEFRRSMAS